MTVKPSPRLAPFVDFLWFDAEHLEHAVESVLPNAITQLVVGLSPDSDAALAPTIVGPRTHPAEIATAPLSRIAGAVFLPGGAAALFGVPMHAFAEHDVPLSEIWDDTDRLWAALMDAPTPDRVLEAFDAALVARLETVAPPRLVGAATAMLDAGAPVARVVAETGYARSTVVRRFTEYVGLTPKRYARLRRFSRAVERIAAGDALVEVAVTCGFFDQAHLGHEFARFARRTPSAYRPRDPHAPNHVR